MEVNPREIKPLNITGASKATIRLEILRQILSLSLSFSLSLAIERDTFLVLERFTFATGKLTICQIALTHLDLELNQRFLTFFYLSTLFGHA